MYTLVDRLRKALDLPESDVAGWRPRVGCDDGIRRLYDWLALSHAAPSSMQAAQ